MKKSNSYQTLEQNIVEHIRSAVFALYAIEWEGIIAPQTKKDALHQQLSIDFTLPCFELARKVSKSPVEIAQSLETYIDAASSKLFAKSFDVHAVSGYVNFTIHDTVLAEYVAKSKEWFAQPAVAQEEYQTQLIAFDDELLGMTGNESTDFAVRYLASLHRVFKSKYRIKILKRDLFEGESKDIRYLTKVAKYLNKLESTNIFGDRATQALYYSDENHDFSLRSVGGKIYGAAIIIFELSRIVYQHDRTPGAKFVILAPQGYHDFIESFLDKTYGKTLDELHIICYDPQVSRANIVEIAESKHTLRSYFKRASRLLETVSQDGVAMFDRVDVLILAHLPTELKRSFHDTQLPILFDSLNQLVTFSGFGLARKNTMEVPANQHRLNEQTVTIQ